MHLNRKTINLLDNTSNQPSKFRAKKYFKKNDESRGIYNVNGKIKFKTTMWKSNLWDYSDAYILVTGTVTIPNTAVPGTNVNNVSKKAIFKNCGPLLIA